MAYFIYQPIYVCVSPLCTHPSLPSARPILFLPICVSFSAFSFGKTLLTVVGEKQNRFGFHNQLEHNIRGDALLTINIVR